MTKHVIDKPKDRSESKAREYMRLEREEGPHAATKQLHARSLGERSVARMREFLRIERGREV